MPQYNKTTWVNDNPPAIDATNLNKMEQGIFDAFRQDGSTTMSGQLVTTAGSAATPAIAPTGDANTGIFFPAADTIAFGKGGTEVMRITSAGNVGIGIDPTNKLHLYQNNTNQQYISISNATSTFLVGQDSSGNMVNYTNQAVNFQWSNSGTPRMTITSSGTVGIGTTTPTALVSMHGSPQATSGAILTLRDTTATGANTTYGAITFLSSPGTDFSIGKASENANSALAFRNANTGAEFMRITSAGNVAIGTTSPLSTLHVQGPSGVTSFTGANRLGFTINSPASLTDYAGIDFTNGFENVAGRIALIRTASGASLSFGTSNLYTSGITNQAMTINPSGNVGIGTTSPTEKLQVNATSGNVGLNINTADAGAVSYLSLSNTGASGKRYSLNVGGNTIGSGLSNNLFLYDNDNAAVRFLITPSGNVGIGTTSPSKKFTVYSSNNSYDECIQVVNTGSLGGSVAGIKFYTENSTAALTGFTVGKLPSGDGHICTIWNENNSAIQIGTNNLERMRITSTGNVGIGTTSPQSILHVTDMGLFSKNQNGPNELIGAYIGNDGSYATLDMRRWTGSGTIHGTGKIQVTDTAAMIFYTDTKSTNTASTTERMRITSAGNVGIGVNPNVELHVKGTGEILRLETTAATGDNFIRFYAPSATTQGYVGYTSAANNNMSINQVLNSDLLFFTDNTERMRIQNSGGVIPSANNTYDLGSATYRWATIYAQNALNTSDARLKKDVAPSSLGLDFINQLNPVQYRWIEGGNTVQKVQTGTETVEISPAIPAQPEVLDEDGNVIQEATQEVPAVTEERPVYEEVITPREGVRTHFGLIAQEVKAALPDGLDFAGWCLADKDDPNSTQSLGYTQLIAPMIKAIQELNAKVEALEAQLNK